MVTILAGIYFITNMDSQQIKSSPSITTTPESKSKNPTKSASVGYYETKSPFTTSPAPVMSTPVPTIVPTSPAPLVCNAGSYSSSGTCQKCNKGSYSLQGSTSCSTCASGTYAGLEGSASCSTCASGTYSSEGASMCTKCQTNKTSAAGSSSCSTCQADEFSSWYSNTSTYLNTNGICKKCYLNVGITAMNSDTTVEQRNIPTPFYIYPCQAYYFNRGNRMLVMQSDGNLVVYRKSQSNGWTLSGSIWRTGTAGNPGSYAVIGESAAKCIKIMAPDPDNDGQYKEKWAAGYNESGAPPTEFRIQEDGNMGLYNSAGGVVWNAKLYI